MTLAEAQTAWTADAERVDRAARAAVEALMAAGQRYGGLFPSILDRITGDMPQTLPPCLPGQRIHDRAFPGCNLMHDGPVLAAMVAMDDACVLAADRYLQRFARHCTDTPTGLFPWGEHAFWDLRQDRIGNSLELGEPACPHVIHDHLRAAPVWLWEKLWRFNPDCVRRFALALDYHWKGGQAEPIEYSRHAFMCLRAFPGRGDPDACDFPRHGGFYILDWAFALSRAGDRCLAQQIERMSDYWWHRRDHTGLCPMESRSSRWPGVRSANQTLSLALSMLEAAELLDGCEPAMSASLRERAAAYAKGYVLAPHAGASGNLAAMFESTSRRVVRMQPLWGGRYGSNPSSQSALLAMAVYRRLGDQALLQLAAEIASHYAQAGAPPGQSLAAADFASCIALLCDLYEQTDEPRWMRAALDRCGEAMTLLFDRDLPRGAVGIDWYEAQLGCGLLIHALSRAGSLARAEPRRQIVNPDYSYR